MFQHYALSTYALTCALLMPPRGRSGEATSPERFGYMDGAMQTGVPFWNRNPRPQPRKFSILAFLI